MYTSVYTFHDVCRLRDLAAERCVCPWERVDVSLSFLIVAEPLKRKSGGDPAGASAMRRAALRCAQTGCGADQGGSDRLHTDPIKYSSIMLLRIAEYRAAMSAIQLAPQQHILACRISVIYDIVDRREVFSRQRLEKLCSAVAFDMGTVKYSRRSMSTSLKRELVPCPCAASMSTIVSIFVTRLMSLSAELLCACSTAGNIDKLGGELFHVNIATVHHILGDADAAWGLVYCFEEHLFDPHQQMKRGLIKSARQLRDEEIDNSKELTPEVLLWIFPLMRCITVIITPWSASRWRECGPLNQAVHGCVLGFFKDAVECLGGSHVSVESGASVSLTALSLVTSLWTGEHLPPPLQMRTLLKIP
ncbi:hypothetical protein GOODEAATRI_021745 [Goodea atripinnis]|uniref:Uncharacterized protein n=1 Tax=Goodea atripinnis TaxID=208336 RepID=A0ABV0PRA6_9TELE